MVTNLVKSGVLEPEVDAGQILAKLYSRFSKFTGPDESQINIHQCEVGLINGTPFPVMIVCPPTMLNTISYKMAAEDQVQKIIINHSGAAIHEYTETHLRLNSGQGQKDDTFSLELATQDNPPNIYPYLKIVNSRGFDSTNSVLIAGRIDSAIILVGLRASDNRNGYWFGGLILEK